MDPKPVKSSSRTFVIVFNAVLYVLLYLLWTGSTDAGDIAVMSVAAVLVAVFFTRSSEAFKPTPKRILYGAAYVPYLFYSIVRSNLDVARRVVRRKIPINPGIVSVTTKLRSPLGRTILANSITLTPGTLSVDIKGDRLFIHWIDVTDTGERGATERIVKGFERFLEVIFG